MEESKKKNKEISEKQNEDSKMEREGFQKLINDLKSENYELKEENKYIKKNLESWIKEKIN